MNPLLAGFIFCACVIQRLFRNHALVKKVFRAVQVDFVIRLCCPGFAQIVRCLLDFLGTRTMLQLLELRSSTIGRAARLVILCFELLIFQSNQHLTFLDLIALLDADPGNTAGDLGISFDSVMRNNVAGCSQDNAASNVAALRCRANYFDLWRRCEKEPIRQRHNPKQYHDDNAANDHAFRPRGGTIADGHCRAVNPQSFKVLMFCINGHSLNL